MESGYTVERSIITSAGLTALLLALFTLPGCDPKGGAKQRTTDQDSTAREPVTATDSVEERKRDLASWAPWSLSFEKVDTLFASELHMIDLFGRANVESGRVNIGEGETMPATILFPDDPERRLKVTWHDNLNATSPERVVIEDYPSIWFVMPGFSTGTALDSLEELNGRPFELLGFEWDYSGTVVNWSEGRLGDLESETNWLVVRLNPTDEDRKRVGEEKLAEVMGDQMFSSSNRTIQDVNPKVYQIMMIFAHNGEGQKE